MAFIFYGCWSRRSTRKERGACIYRTDPSRVMRGHQRLNPRLPTAHPSTDVSHNTVCSTTLSYTSLSLSQRLLNSVVVLYRGPTNPSRTFPQPRAAFFMQSVALTCPPVRSAPCPIDRAFYLPMGYQSHCVIDV